MVARKYRSSNERSRSAMIGKLEQRGIDDRCVLAAMTVVPRELFVQPRDVLAAYDDRALSIGEGQTMSPPSVVAAMLQVLELEPTDTVLELGTGSGYTAAVLSQLVSHVYTVERDPALAVRAAERLATLGYDGIDVHCGDGVHGWPEYAPYDAIIITEPGLPITDALIEQVAEGGRLVRVDDVTPWPGACSAKSA
jgi:protein-L-isoaspartate(D-aspartate) O-methyltransferase